MMILNSVSSHLLSLSTCALSIAAALSSMRSMRRRDRKLCVFMVLCLAMVSSQGKQLLCCDTSRNSLSSSSGLGMQSWGMVSLSSSVRSLSFSRVMCSITLPWLPLLSSSSFSHSQLLLCSIMSPLSSFPPILSVALRKRLSCPHSSPVDITSICSPPVVMSLLLGSSLFCQM